MTDADGIDWPPETTHYPGDGTNHYGEEPMRYVQPWRYINAAGEYVTMTPHYAQAGTYIGDITTAKRDPRSQAQRRPDTMAATDRFSKADIVSLASQLARAQKYIAELEDRYIEEPPNNGSVVRFMVTYGPRSMTAFPPDTINPNPTATVFMYAAIRASDKWYVTGQNSPQALEWVELLAWLDEKATATSKIEVWPPDGTTAELLEKHIETLDFPHGRHEKPPFKGDDEELDDFPERGR